MNQRLLLSLWIILFIYMIIRMIRNMKSVDKPQQTNRIDEVIQSDKYKAKGQHDN